jgi:hypothetical protein
MDQTMRGFEVLHGKLHQFLAAQRTVVSQRHHQPVPQRLDRGGAQDPLPVPLVGDPRRLLQPPHQALPRAATATA